MRMAHEFGGRTARTDRRPLRGSLPVRLPIDRNGRGRGRPHARGVRQALARLALREPDRAKAWLFRILRNLYLHKVRDEKRHRVVPLDAVGDLPGRETEEPPEINAAKLQQALDELDEGFRTPLILFYFEEFSYRDIAEQMELPIGTVMSRLARAKAYLRAKLCPNGTEEFAAAEGRKEVSDAVS